MFSVMQLEELLAREASTGLYFKPGYTLTQKLDQPQDKAPTLRQSCYFV